MSLNVYLYGEEYEVECVCPECDHKHTRKTHETYYTANITHNLNKMADAAGIYETLWRPDEMGVQRGKDLIVPLRAGVDLLKSDPERFRKYDASNGWGTYENFVPWLERYLAACEEHPEAHVEVSR